MEIPEYQDAKDIILMVIKRKAPATILVSKGGLGKSYLAKTLVEEYCPNDYEYRTGHITPLALYQLFYDNRDKTVILDDVEEVFENDTAHHTDDKGSHDWEIYDEYIDYITGSKRNRTNLNRLMEDARRHKFKTVVIWKVDRLGRSVQHMLQIVEEWRNLGIDFVVTTLGMDTSTASGRLVFGILAQIAEFERELTIERTKLAHERAKKEGRHWGRPKGKKDSKPRRKSGYYQRWSKQGKKVTP